MKAAPIAVLIVLAFGMFIIPVLPNALAFTPITVPHTGNCFNASGHSCTTAAVTVAVGQLVVVNIIGFGSGASCPASLSVVFLALVFTRVSDTCNVAGAPLAKVEESYWTARALISTSGTANVTAFGPTVIAVVGSIEVIDGGSYGLLSTTPIYFQTNYLTTWTSPHFQTYGLLNQTIVSGEIGVTSWVTTNAPSGGPWVCTPAGPALNGTGTSYANAFMGWTTLATGCYDGAVETAANTGAEGINAVFGTGALFPTTFTSSILNLDCGNCVIAGNNKFYDFHENMTSYAISNTAYNRNFSSMYIQFNDTVHIINIAYNFATAQTTLSRSAAGVVTLAHTIAKVTYNPVTQVYKATVDFYVAFNTNVLDAQNRNIQFQGCLPPVFPAPGVCLTKIVRQNYFNIINQGGLTNTLIDGNACSKVPGGDVFSTQCFYRAADPSSIATNSTWIDLQSYDTQFSLVTTNSTFGTCPACLGPYMWQQYQGGMTPSSNHNDWTTTIGFYYFDNTTWVLGPNVKIAMLLGNEGGNNQWTILETSYYFGHTLISNQSISVWIEQNPLTQTRLFVDIWYATVNASTTFGMRVNAYYVGMQNGGFFHYIWPNWAPIYNNASTTQAYGTLLNHLGKTISSTQIQCTTVFWNMTRFGAGGRTLQVNFPIVSNKFELQQFNLAGSLQQMGGVVTPIYTQPLVPIIQTTSNFLSPIYAAIAAIAGFFVKALVALGNVIWGQLGARFPWFTNSITTFDSLLLSYVALLLVVAVYLLDVLKFLYGIVGLVITPINIIISAYNYIQITYLPIFGGLNLATIIEIFVIVFFTSYLFDAFYNGDTGKLVNLTKTAWHVTNSILTWSWALAKILIDTIEGLIP